MIPTTTKSLSRSSSAGSTRSYGSGGAHEHELRGHSPPPALSVSDDDEKETWSTSKEDSFLLQRSPSTEVAHAHFKSVIFNTATALLGASMFSLPWAFQQTGVIGGSAVLLLVALVAGETALLLLMAQRAIFERSGRILRYPEIAEEILGHEHWATFIRTATIISCIGGCCGYMIFLGQVSEQLLSLPYSTALYGLALPLILVSWVRSFEELSFFTIIGVFAIVCSVVAILYGGYKQNDPLLFDFSDVVLFDPGAAFQFIGVVTFTFTIHYCVLSMGEEVLHNTKYIPRSGPVSTLSTGGLTRPLVIAYTASSLCICFLGVAGYVAYRHSDLIRLALPCPCLALCR
jgi:amino acid permease